MYGTVTDRRCIIGFKRKCRSHPVTYVTPLSFSEPVVNPFALKLFGHRRFLGSWRERKEAQRKVLMKFDTFLLHRVIKRESYDARWIRSQKKRLYINMLYLIVFILEVTIWIYMRKTFLPIQLLALIIEIILKYCVQLEAKVNLINISFTSSI